MPVVATPTTPTIVSADQVRMFLRDFASNNILLDDVQFKNEEIDLALEMAVSAFNAITPQTSMTPSSFPKHLQYLLLLGTTRFLMMSETFNQVRSSAVYQDGDISPLGLSEKQAAYSAIAQNLRSEWDELARGIKTETNMYSAFGSLGSGYINTSRFNR